MLICSGMSEGACGSERKDRLESSCEGPGSGNRKQAQPLGGLSLSSISSSCPTILPVHFMDKVKADSLLK